MAFTCCYPLRWLLIWLWSEVVDPCFIHCHIFMQKLIFVVLKWLQTTLNYRHVFDQLWANAAPTLNTAFSLTNIHAKWWIHCLLISSSPLLSHATSIYDWPKQVWSFLVFSGTTAKFKQLGLSASFVSVWPHLKSAYHLLTVVSDGSESE